MNAFSIRVNIDLARFPASLPPLFAYANIIPFEIEIEIEMGSETQCCIGDKSHRTLSFRCCLYLLLYVITSGFA